MNKLNEHTDYLAAFSRPEYDIDKRYNVVYLDENRNICYLDNSSKWRVLVCPLLNDLDEKDTNEFKAYAYKVHNVEHTVIVDGGARGKGIFCIFRRIEK